jgi:hypothetical protein
MTPFSSSSGASTQVVGRKKMGHLPHPPIQALKQGSVGPVLSDLQAAIRDEKAQHMDAYRYAHGHNDGGGAMGNPSF